MVFATGSLLLECSEVENLSRTVADHLAKENQSAPRTDRVMPIFSERRIARMERAATSGRVIPYLAAVTVVVTLGSAVFVEVFSPKSFGSFGDALWWAAQTVTTVGYGDVVPQTNGGRLVAVVVMVFGVAAVSLTMAIVTSGFVAQAQRVRQETELAGRPPVHEALARIEDRLERIEQRLTD